MRECNLGYFQGGAKSKKSRSNSNGYVKMSRRKVLIPLLVALAAAIMAVGATSYDDGKIRKDSSLEYKAEIKADDSHNAANHEIEVDHEEYKINSTSFLDECGLWLAPSTIPGAGYGMFSGKKFKRKEELTKTGDIAIPIIDISVHQQKRKQWNFFWDSHVWECDAVGMGHEVHEECSVASPGLGAAVNCFFGLINVDDKKAENDIPHGLHRSQDPGAGGFSAYHNRKAEAKIDIQAGQELFVDYGQHWFENREEFGPIPLYHGLKKSTHFYQRFQQLKNNHPQVENVVYEELWDTFVKHSAFNESRIFGAFTHTKFERYHLIKNYTLQQIRQKESTRSIEWLREYGSCADNMYEGPSTIRQAGRGAYASRELPSGTILSVMPLIPVHDKVYLEMYDISTLEENTRPPGSLVGQQLLVNYCLGHVDSTMLLCPYGLFTSLINHNKTLKNVKLKWTDSETGNYQHELFKKGVDYFAKKGHSAQLSMELVTTHDIAKDEEIFLDYGNAWELAWQNHLQNWKPPEESAEYMSAYQMNQEVKQGRFQTEFEQMTHPYPRNVNIECDVNIWTNINTTLFETTSEISVINQDSSEHWLCDVLQHHRVNGTSRYTVIASQRRIERKNKNLNTRKIKGGKVTSVRNSDKRKNQVKRGNFLIVKLTGIPQMAIRFTDRPYTTDIFLRSAFRHPIQIPDDLFPSKWKNLLPHDIRINNRL